MNDEQLLLANAYVDGELTADERRIAESDPDVMSEVERLRVVQQELRAVAPPSQAARDAAIGAAMAEFAVASGSTDDAAAPVAPINRRSNQSRYLAVAAALVAVAGLGVIVSQIGGGDDDSLDTADVAAVAEADDRLTESVAADDGEDAGGDDADDSDLDESATFAADAAPQAEAAGEATADVAEAMEESAVDEMAADDALDADVAGDGAEAGSAAAPMLSIPADFDPDAVIEQLADLTAIGIYLRIERDAQRLPPSPNTACAGAYEALRRGEFDDGSRRRAVLIAVDERRGLVYAIDETTCGILLEAPVR